MNIVLVNRFYPPDGFGGIAIYNYYLAQELVRLGHHVSVITARLSEEIPAHEIIEGIHVHRIINKQYSPIHRLPFIGKYMRTYRQLVYSFRVARFLQKMQRKNKVDVVEFAEVEAEGFIYLLSKKRGLVVVRCHTPTFILSQYAFRAEVSYHTDATGWLEKYCIRHADRVTAPSRDMQDVVRRLCSKISFPMEVIPNGLRPEEFAADNSSRSSSKNCRVLFVGRLDRLKGIDILKQAIAVIYKKNPDIYFTFIGGDNKGSTQRWKEALNIYFESQMINPRVEILGGVDQKTLVEWYQKSDIAVAPSLLYESFSYTCAQAMAAGLPIVASRIGGIPETVDDGINGILVQPGDEWQLAHAILRLADDPELRLRMGQAGKQKANQVFHVSQTAKAFVKMVESLRVKTS